MLFHIHTHTRFIYLYAHLYLKMCALQLVRAVFRFNKARKLYDDKRFAAFLT